MRKLTEFIKRYYRSENAFYEFNMKNLIHNNLLLLIAPFKTSILSILYFIITVIISYIIIAISTLTNGNSSSAGGIEMLAAMMMLFSIPICIVLNTLVYTYLNIRLFEKKVYNIFSYITSLIFIIPCLLKIIEVSTWAGGIMEYVPYVTPIILGIVMTIFRYKKVDKYFQYAEEEEEENIEKGIFHKEIEDANKEFYDLKTVDILRNNAILFIGGLSFGIALIIVRFIFILLGESMIYLISLETIIVIAVGSIFYFKSLNLTKLSRDKKQILLSYITIGLIIIKNLVNVIITITYIEYCTLSEITSNIGIFIILIGGLYMVTKKRISELDFIEEN